MTEDMKMGALASMLFVELETHIQVNSTRLTTYELMREEVGTFLDAKMSKSFAEQRIQGTNNQPPGGYSNYSGLAPMDLDAMTSGKGKRGFQGNCYNCGQHGHSAKNCPKGKGKGSS